MYTITFDEILGTESDVTSCYGHCKSARLLKAADGFGFSLNVTRINSGSKVDLCYKRHFEACYCIEGSGEIRDAVSQTAITPGTLYALKKGEAHTLIAITDLVLISIFNPPLVGHETHNSEGSY